MSSSLIQIRDLGKMYKLYNNPKDRVKELFGLNFGKPSYREFWVLRNIDLDIKSGERIGIVGRNGAGKSTLLKIISGFIKPTEGNLRVSGKVQALMELGTGFHPELTGLENIHSALSLMGYSYAQIKSFEEEIIDFSELEDFISQPVKFYSAGMYTRLAFSVSTCIQPEILIIDEVLGAGDASFSKKCAQRIKKITHDLGATVLFVSHSMSSVVEFCERAILIENGSISHDSDALAISKIYDTKIRAEEELSLLAKEVKLRKRDLRKILSDNHSKKTLMFRFITESSSPKKAHKIMSASLLINTVKDSELKIGSPMDNDFQAENHIIDAVGLTNWSKPLKSGGRMYRLFQNVGGSYHHAPFQLGAKNQNIPLCSSSIQVEADIHHEEIVYLDVFCSDKYIRLGQLDSNSTISTFPLFPIIEETSSGAKEASLELLEKTDITPKEPIRGGSETLVKGLPETFEELKKSNSVYGSCDITVEEVDITDESFVSHRVFTVGQEINFIIKVFSPQKIYDFTLVVCIMYTDGRCASQVFCPAIELLKDFSEDRVTFLARFSPLRLGEGDYITSIGIFKTCNFLSPAEDSAYIVVDRVLNFKIKQPFEMKKSLGAFAHEVEWSCGDRSLLYEPATKDGKLKFSMKEKVECL